MENNDEFIKKVRLASLYRYLEQYIASSDNTTEALQDINHVTTVLFNEQGTHNETRTS
jgi:hypothetical protein